jgi:hypothetical protein
MDVPLDVTAVKPVGAPVTTAAAAVWASLDGAETEVTVVAAPPTVAAGTVVVLTA